MNNRAASRKDRSNDMELEAIKKREPMKLEELREKITAAIELYDLLVQLKRTSADKYKADKQRAEELEDIDTALELEKKITSTYVDILAYVRAQGRLRRLLNDSEDH